MRIHHPIGLNTNHWSNRDSLDQLETRVDLNIHELTSQLDTRYSVFSCFCDVILIRIDNDNDFGNINIFEASLS